MQLETQQDCLDAIKTLETFPTDGLPEVVIAAIRRYADRLADYMDELPTEADVALFPEAIRLANLYAAKRGYSAVTGVAYQEHILRWVAVTEDSNDGFTIGPDRGIDKLPQCIEWLRGQVGEAVTSTQ